MDNCGYGEDAINLAGLPLLISSPGVCFCGQSKGSKDGSHSTSAIELVEIFKVTAGKDWYTNEVAAAGTCFMLHLKEAFPQDGNN